MGDERQETDRQNRTRFDRPGSFDCCGTEMPETMTGCRCGDVMRRHPFAASVFLLIMGLALLVIPAGAVLGVIAFFRTI